MPTVHGVALSPFVRKVRVALIEKGVDYELNPIMPMGDPPELAAMNPLAKVPVYEEDGFFVPDSSVVIAYLERRHPDPRLYPTDDRQFAQALFLEEYADTRLLDATLPYFAEKIVKRLTHGEPDPGAIPSAIEAQQTVFPYLESRIGSNALDGIVGGRFSIADIAIASPFVNMRLAGGEIDAARFPKLSRYLAAVHARPSFKGLIEEERLGLPG